MAPSKHALATAGTLALAAVVALGAATVSVGMIERTTQAEIVERLQDEGHGWAEVRTDGLLVSLSGESPSEAARFRALTLAGMVVDGARVLDEMTVRPGLEIAAPEFRLELLRNDDTVSVIGLVPLSRGADELAERIEGLSAGMAVSEMVETADYPVPPNWDRAVAFAIEAMRALPMSKLSVSADRIEVSGLVRDDQSRRELEARLRQGFPSGMELVLDITAPRPVITPFTLRVAVDDGALRFDACSADSEAARDAILEAGQAAGAARSTSCTVGMGAPTQSWSDGAVAAIAAVSELGSGAVTMSDTEVSLVVPHGVSQSRFDRVAGALEARLPEVFSLEAVLLAAPDPDAEDAEAAREFLAMLDADGVLQLQGRLTDERIRDAVQSFARARFGLATVEMTARLDPDLPEGWPLKALTAIDALAELDEGAAHVRPDRIELRGVSGNADASDVVSRIMSDKLGQGADFRVSVVYDEARDPASQVPTPERCEAWIREILTDQQITFAPGSTRVAGAASETLNAIAEVMRDCGPLEMEVGGHTDSQGSADGNLALSQSRAEAVIDALMERQVLISGLVSRGYDEDRPIADNSTAAGREANRRIEFRLLSRIAQAPVIPAERDPELEATLEIRVSDGAGDMMRPEPRPADD